MARKTFKVACAMITVLWAFTAAAQTTESCFAFHYDEQLYQVALNRGHAPEIARILTAVGYSLDQMLYDDLMDAGVYHREALMAASTFQYVDEGPTCVQIREARRKLLKTRVLR